MHGVDLWVGGDGIIRLHGTSGTRGRINPAALRAEVLLRLAGPLPVGARDGGTGADVRAVGDSEWRSSLPEISRVPAARRVDETDSLNVRAGVDLHHMLTVAAAVLIGRLGRVFLHAAGLVGPEGGAWLLVGDAGAGKSSTAATLVADGWDWLADDRVLLDAPRLAGPPRVQGWARRFRLDTGWARRAPQGTRRLVDPARLGPGRRSLEAPLGGLLFPRVEPDEPTALEPIPAGEALAGLVRQAPWLFLDPAAAPALLRLLARAANAPAFALRLGRDVYGEPERLRGVLAEALSDASAEAVAATSEADPGPSFPLGEDG